MSIRQSQKGAQGPNRTGRKHEMPELTSPVLCVQVPVMLPLLPYFRLFFSRMYQANMWRTPEDAARAKNYFSQQEAMLLQCQNTAIESQTTATNDNFCMLTGIVVALLSDGAIPPATIAGLCELVKTGLQSVEGSVEWDGMLAALLNIDEKSVGKDSNQLENYLHGIAEALGYLPAPEVD